jgi:hypothetical protein
MSILGLLGRLCVLAFVLAGIVVEVTEWRARRRAIRTLLHDLGVPEPAGHPSPLDGIVPRAARGAEIVRAIPRTHAADRAPDRPATPGAPAPNERPLPPSTGSASGIPRHEI